MRLRWLVPSTSASYPARAALTATSAQRRIQARQQSLRPLPDRIPGCWTEVPALTSAPLAGRGAVSCPMFVLSLALGFALPQGLPVPQKMPAPGLSRSVDPSLPSLLTDIPEARVSLLYSVDSCLQLAARQNINLILQHYNYTGKLGRRRPQEDKMGLLKVAFITISCLIVVENLLVLIAIVRSLHARRWVYSCILAARQNINLILQHYNYTGKLGRRRPQEDKMGLLEVAFIAISCLIVVENLLVLIAIVRSLHARRLH
nr:sphingosine 1-phosphate receptor 4 [Chrysemys picta bellii]